MADIEVLGGGRGPRIWIFHRRECAVELFPIPAGACLVLPVDRVGFGGTGGIFRDERFIREGSGDVNPARDRLDSETI